MLIRKRLLIPFLILILAVLGSMIFFLFQERQKPSALPEEPIHCNLLIKNGTLVDGTGKGAFKADVAITGDRIIRIGDFSAKADKTVNAEGLIVAPGFINPHSHIDQTILTDPNAEASLMQGVTTEIVGLDGLSVVDFDSHFDQIAEKGTGVNYGSLVGQGSIRQAVMGDTTRRAAASEIASMQQMVNKAMEQGALGLSTGLEYTPGISTSTEEIIELAKAVSPYNGVYVSHIRNERDNVVDAVKEALEISKAAQAPAVISHIKIGSSIYDSSREQIIARNTGEVIKTINDFCRKGGQAYADIYPYRVTWFQINRPPQQVVWKYPAEIILVSAGSNKSYIGKTIAEIAAAEKNSAVAIAQKLVEDSSAMVCVQNLTEDSIQQLLQAPFTVIGMDNTIYWDNSSYVPPEHPRNYGTYPRVLGKYVTEGLLTMEEAIHKMSGKTAGIYGIEKRGTIKEGNYADLVIFDAKTIKDRATYWQPQLYPEGISFVIVNGKIAVADGNYTGPPSGKILRRRN